MFLTIASMPAPARGHPHVFIETRSTLRFEAGALVAIDCDWRFDPLFSKEVLGLVGKPKPPFDAETAARIKKVAFDNLRDYGYFVHARAGSTPASVQHVREFTAAMLDKNLQYKFTVVLSRPLDPRGGEIEILLYDDSYFVDVGFAEPISDAFRLANAPQGCEGAAIEDKKKTIYFGSVHPMAIVVACPAR